MRAPIAISGVRRRLASSFLAVLATIATFGDSS
jgi:hypothetical protein